MSAIWQTSQINFETHYFNHDPEKISLSCESVELIQAKINTRYGAGGDFINNIVTQPFLICSEINTLDLKNIPTHPSLIWFESSTGRQEFQVFEVEITRNSEIKVILR